MAGRNIDEKLRCSFCNKTQDQVKKLIAGHNGVYICDECVEICSDILDEEFETGGKIPCDINKCQMEVKKLRALLTNAKMEISRLKGRIEEKDGFIKMLMEKK